MTPKRTWTAVTIRADAVVLESIANFLFESGSCGLEEGDDFVKAYFESIPSEDFRIRLDLYLAQIRETGGEVGNPQFEEVAEADWSVGWRAYFKPVVVTPGIVVKPPWEAWPAAPDQIVIDIYPRMAFGTGTHETTQLCLTLIEKYLKPDVSVLDVGTGSGVLAIAARMLGAGQVLGVEIDEDALENAFENLKLNGLEGQVAFRPGSLEVVGRARFDLLIANINRTALTSLVPEFHHYLHDGATMLLSGILAEEQALMKDVLERSNFTVDEVVQKGEWVGMVVRRKS